MIIVNIVGGLGNQMFQWAFARALSVKSNTELKLDLSEFEDYKLRNYGLSVFNIVENIATEDELVKFNKKRIFGPKIIKEKSLKFNPKYTKPAKSAYLKGYWQSEKYFKGVEDIIRADFTLKNPLSTTAQKYKDKIISKNAVSIHIRRGDYVGNAIYDLDLIPYYKKTIEHIEKLVENPDFFIFTDDEEYALKYFADFNLVEGLKPHEDMHLMSLCKHNIIANSSFSWWGAWLNDNPEKIVIAPNAWFSSKSLDSSTIVPDSWVRM